MTNMRVMTMAHIRNARGLCPEEKAILYTVESRGEVYSNVDTFRADCGGMSKDRFYRHRRTLIEKGLLLVTDRRPKGTTIYRVDSEAVAARAPDDALKVMGSSVMGNPDSTVLETETTTYLKSGSTSQENQDTKRTSQRGPLKGTSQSGLLRAGALPYDPSDPILFGPHLQEAEEYANALVEVPSFWD